MHIHSVLRINLRWLGHVVLVDINLKVLWRIKHDWDDYDWNNVMKDSSPRVGTLDGIVVFNGLGHGQASFHCKDDRSEDGWDDGHRLQLVQKVDESINMYHIMERSKVFTDGLQDGAANENVVEHGQKHQDSIEYAEMKWTLLTLDIRTNWEIELSMSQMKLQLLFLSDKCLRPWRFLFLIFRFFSSSGRFLSPSYKGH